MKSLMIKIVTILGSVLIGSGTTLGIVSIAGADFSHNPKEAITTTNSRTEDKVIQNHDFLLTSASVEEQKAKARKIKNGAKLRTDPATRVKYHRIEEFGMPLSAENMVKVSSQQGVRNVMNLDNGGTAGKVYHNAIDISVPEGTDVYATKEGKIINVYPSYYNGGALYKGHPTYGGLVEIQHYDGTKTLYAHLSLTLVKEGDTVEKGQRIGQSGGVAGKRGSGLSTGPHLHYSIMLDLNTFVAKI